MAFSPPFRPARRDSQHKIPVLEPAPKIHAGLPGEERQVEAGAVEGVDGGDAFQNVQHRVRSDAVAHQLGRRPVAGEVHGDADDSRIGAATDETGGLDVQIGVQRGTVSDGSDGRR